VTQCNQLQSGQSVARVAELRTKDGSRYYRSDTSVAAAATVEVGCHGNGRGHNKLASYRGLLGACG